MKLERRKGSVFLTPEGITESHTKLDWNSDANDESWTAVFQDIANECTEFQPPPDIKIWRGSSGDELVCRIDNAESHLMPIRRFGKDVFITMHVPQRVWDVYKEHTDVLHKLGVKPRLDTGTWQLLYRDITPIGA